MTNTYSHYFVLNQGSSGGEQILLKTTFHKVESELDPFITQELTLNSYNNSVTFNTQGIFNPERLGQLVTELKEAESKAKTLFCLTSST